MKGIPLIGRKERRGAGEGGRVSIKLKTDVGVRSPRIQATEKESKTYHSQRRGRGGGDLTDFKNDACILALLC